MLCMGAMLAAGIAEHCAMLLRSGQKQPVAKRGWGLQSFSRRKTLYSLHQR